jgi:quercetin 2,3-dioxygenase
MKKTAIIKINPLDFMWPTLDPFLFCVHHEDFYPSGNDEFGPNSSLKGRNIGQDFTIKDGWRMYHGDKVPGFPAHPHRGFETVTVVTEGVVDHADSMGAAGRYGGGDTQWMTAGKGIQHSEMFPLLNRDQGNKLELFQIWLNLPGSHKMVEPHFTMLWKASIPIHEITDDNGKKTKIDIIAGMANNCSPPKAPPDSWAADQNNKVAIWLIKMEPNAHYSIPAEGIGLNRSLYFYDGLSLNIDGTDISPMHSAELDSSSTAPIINGNKESCLLFLQGRPIREPIAHHGPFVMNTETELEQTFKDYRETGFGGWPWSASDQVHSRSKGRFARHKDGHEEEPDK